MKKIYVLILFAAIALTSCGGSSEEKVEAAIDSTIVACPDTCITTVTAPCTDTTVKTLEVVK